MTTIGSMRHKALALAVASSVTVGVAAMAFPTAASAFNPQPDPPGKVFVEISGPDPCTITEVIASLLLIRVTAPLGHDLPASICAPPVANVP